MVKNVFYMNKYSWILNLPADSPEHFGQAIKKITVDCFDLERKGQASEKLAENLHISRRIVQPWLKGKLDHDRTPFTREHFRNLMTLFWERKVLGREEIIKLARCAGEDYFFETRKSWLKELTGIDLSVTKYPPGRDDRYPLPTVILPRENILEEIQTKIIPALQIKQSIVIYGKPGMGKTTLIQHLEKEWERSAKLQHLFPNGIMAAYLGSKKPDFALHKWLEVLYGELDFSSFDQTGLRNLLKKAFANKRSLLLIDDVSDITHAHALMQADPSSSVAIITTTNPDVAAQLSKNPQFIIKMDGLTRVEAQRLYALLTGRSEFDTKLLEKIRVFSGGNPLVLHGVISLLPDFTNNAWEVLKEEMDDKRTRLPENSKNTVFLVQYMLYEKVLSPYLQKKLRALGALGNFFAYETEIFTFLWGCHPDETKRVLENLQRYGYLIKLRGDGLWDIHKSVLEIAKDFLEEQPKEYEHASLIMRKWKETSADTAAALQIISLRDVIRSFFQKVFNQVSLSAQDNIPDFSVFIHKHTDVFTAGEAAGAMLLHNKDKSLDGRIGSLQKAALISLISMIIFLSLKPKMAQVGLFFAYGNYFLVCLCAVGMIVLSLTQVRLIETLYRLKDKAVWRFFGIENE